MGKSQETFNKKEREKKRIKKRQDKAEKMEHRKSDGKKKSMDDMMAYLDENGNLTSTPPDPRRRIEVKQEDIQISVTKQEFREEADVQRNGVVSFFNDDKGFGFINDTKTGERVFVHVNQLSFRIKENDKVTFEVQ